MIPQEVLSEIAQLTSKAQERTKKNAKEVKDHTNATDPASLHPDMKLAEALAGRSYHHTHHYIYVLLRIITYHVLILCVGYFIFVAIWDVADCTMYYYLVMYKYIISAIVLYAIIAVAVHGEMFEKHRLIYSKRLLTNLLHSELRYHTRAVEELSRYVRTLWYSMVLCGVHVVPTAIVLAPRHSCVCVQHMDISISLSFPMCMCICVVVCISLDMCHCMHSVLVNLSDLQPNPNPIGHPAPPVAHHSLGDTFG